METDEIKDGNIQLPPNGDKTSLHIYTLHSIYAQYTTLSAPRTTLNESLTPESCFRVGSSAIISAVDSLNLKIF